MAHLGGGAVRRHVDHRLNQPVARGRLAWQRRDAIVVTLAFLCVIWTDTEGDGRLGAPAVLREELAQRMPLLVVDVIGQRVADVVDGDICDRMERRRLASAIAACMSRGGGIASRTAASGRSSAPAPRLSCRGQLHGLPRNGMVEEEVRNDAVRESAAVAAGTGLSGACLPISVRSPGDSWPSPGSSRSP